MHFIELQFKDKINARRRLTGCQNVSSDAADVNEQIRFHAIQDFRYSICQGVN